MLGRLALAGAPVVRVWLALADAPAVRYVRLALADAPVVRHLDHLVDALAG